MALQQKRFEKATNSNQKEKELEIRFQPIVEEKDKIVTENPPSPKVERSPDPAPQPLAVDSTLPIPVTDNPVTDKQEIKKVETEPQKVAQILKQNPPKADSIATQPPSSQPVKATTPTSSTPSEKTNKKVVPVETGGGGNCQLLSILKGIEVQYPNLLTKFLENGKPIQLTHQKLREMGVQFARDQLDKCGKYAQEVLGYVDTDRKEYNNCLFARHESRFQYRLNALKRNLDSKKILPSTYEKQKQNEKKNIKNLKMIFIKEMISKPTKSSSNF